MLQSFSRWAVGGAVLLATIPLARGAIRAASAAPALTATSTPGGAALRVATVNLEVVMKHLDQAQSAQAKLAQRLQTFKDQVALKEKALQKLREPLNPESTISFKPNTPEYKAQADKVLKAELALKLFQQYQEIKLQVRRQVIEGLIYRAINAAVAKYAKAHGIGLVLVDSGINYNVPKEADLLAQIQNRKVMYAEPGLDISNAVAQMMNQAYASKHGDGD